jgi:hypothetical protein
MSRVADNSEVASEQQVIFELAGRCSGDLKEASQLLSTILSAAFGNIRRNRASSASDLQSQGRELAATKATRLSIHLES